MVADPAADFANCAGRRAGIHMRGKRRGERVVSRMIHLRSKGGISRL